MTLSIIGALVTGLVGASFIANSKQSVSDPETIFIFLSQFLFHPFVAGCYSGHSCRYYEHHFVTIISVVELAG
ncbi:hypothetical protein [Pseudoalteromonas piratica]|uniref:hypothetical protein n=1 Tax=Pseudoalteromonas piratica TaxID=1348114 RepID=UPI000AD12BF6|nr:hypothetical protein [Pseudoalteromonas piratica]